MWRGLVLKSSDPLPALVADLVGAFQPRRLPGFPRNERGQLGRSTAATSARPPASPVDGALSLPLSEDATLVIRGDDLRAEDREVVHGFANQIAVAFAGRRLQAEAASATALAKANELRTALLAP